MYDFDVTVPSATLLAGLKKVVTLVDDNVVKRIGSDEHLKIVRQPLDSTTFGLHNQV